MTASTKINLRKASIELLIWLAYESNSPQAERAYDEIERRSGR
jgi:hypothetical protein